MQATHTHRVDIIEISSFSDTVIELFKNCSTISFIVPLTIACFVPFRCCSIVEKQWLTMASSNHNAPFVCHLLTFGVAIEGTSAGVHRRSEHIAFQSENKFANSVIGLGANVTQLLFIVL